MVVLAIAIAVTVLRVPQPEGAEAAVPEVSAEPAPGAAAAEAEAPAITLEPLPAGAATPWAGCQETGMRVTIGCGGGAGIAPLESEA
jgi:hypothetical protein